MKLCPTFIFLPIELKFCWNPPNNCQFHINVCCHKHTVWKGVNERSDFLRPLSIKLCGVHKNSFGVCAFGISTVKAVLYRGAI